MEMPCFVRLPAILVAAALLVASAAQAQGFADPATGFAISPPDAFTALRTTNRQGFDVTVGIQPKAEFPTPYLQGRFLCEATFKAAAENTKLSQTEINALVDKPAWCNLIVADFNLTFDIVSQRRFTLQGFRGIELTLRLKGSKPGDDPVLLASLVNTAKGRTMLICNTFAKAMPAAVGSFRAIRQSITLPK
jgi:hypothetical protein